jgi:serine/threonine protein phosphatase 1
MRWVIGDIHGMYAALHDLVEAVARQDGAARFIFVGDYVNRGPDSRKVIDLLLSLPGAAFVRGNHDDVFDLVLSGTCYDAHSAAPDPVSAFGWFMNHGLANTFTSYDVDYAQLEEAERRPTPQRLRDIAGAVPAPHRQFIHGLPPVVEEPDLFVAHAMWGPDDRDDAPTVAARLESLPRLRHRVLWGRYTADQIRRPKRWTRTGYFGHTPIEAMGPLVHRGRNVPVRGPKIVLLDTGAALSAAGRLSAVCAETAQVVQTERSGAVVAEAP